MKPKNLFTIIVAAVLLPSLLLGGCFQRSLTFQVRFPDVAGLKIEDPVYFEKNDIGKVNNITYTTQGDYLVTIVLIPGFKNAATEDSRFFVGNDPVNTSG